MPELDPKVASKVNLSKLSDTEIQARHAAKEKATASRQQAGDIEVPSELNSPHPLIKATARRLKQRDGWSSEKGLRSAPGEVLNIEVSRASLDRALLIADTLIKVLARQGITTTVDSSSNTTFFDVQGTQIRFAIIEYVKRSAHQVTPAEQRAREQYWNRSLLGNTTIEYPRIPQYDYQPTGILTIRVGRWPSRNWKDAERIRLETRLGQVVTGLVSLAEEIKFSEEERAKREEQHRRTVELYESMKARFEREEADFKRLEAEAACWERATKLRGYIEAVEHQALNNGSLTDAIVEWVTLSQKSH